MNQYRCETCKNCSKNPNDDNFCLIMNDEIDFTDFEHTAKVGCASHSDFQSERDKSLTPEYIDERNRLIRKDERERVLGKLEQLLCAHHKYVGSYRVISGTNEEIYDELFGAMQELRQKDGE